jgi:outer membrane receptor protein involved in Fe transport
MKKITILGVFLCFTLGLFAQNKVAISGMVKDKKSSEAIAYANVLLKMAKDSAFVSGVVTDENGRFSFESIAPNNYFLEVSYIGYLTKKEPLYVGNLSAFLDVKAIDLEENVATLEEAVVTGEVASISGKMDKKTYDLSNNVSQSGGSVLESMQNLPGVTVQDGKVALRGSEQVVVMIDGKQSALSQSGLGNIPASAIERIEIINNPSAKFDANGNAGIINIIYKKNEQTGFNGTVGLAGGLGALWVKKENLPTIRPQYTRTPKVNPSLSLNYRKKDVNLFLQGDYLYKPTLNKNEFITRTYDDGMVIQQQTKRNRETHFSTAKMGIDWFINDQNKWTTSAYFSSEKILDYGDQPFFNADLSERLRLWQFLEDELKTTVIASSNFNHKFEQVGHELNIGLNYTFHRENEQYFFDNIYPTFTGRDVFKLLSDEHIADFNLDYTKPLKTGRIEAGIRFRKRNIPTNMQFFSGLNSPLDTGAGGAATYKETIPAVYGNYVFENQKYEVEVGLRLEYVDLQYLVNENHNTYKSDGYSYFQPFPNMRLAYKINDYNKISLFFNRRVDRPNEVDIRIFPKYDDAEIIKVGNPALKPQFTNTVELGYKKTWENGSLYAAAYHRMSNGTITRISVTVPGSNLIYAVFQNAGKSYNTGLEAVLSQELADWYSFNLNVNAYRNQIDAFTVENLYPVPNTFTADRQEAYSGTLKFNNIFKFSNGVKAQLSAIYLAPDIIPQGKIGARFSLDAGLKKSIQNGKGEIFANATDLLNTMVIRKEIQGNNFSYTSSDYYETQVIRIGYNYKF